MKFLKNNELKLQNGGYLVEKETGKPIYHAEFIKIQEEAHYLVNLANTVRASDFTVKDIITFDSIVKSVKEKLSNETKTYIESPVKVSMPMFDKLQKEALSWITGKTEETKTIKLNRILQKYNVLANFEEFGLYFSEDNIVKLKELYTLEQLVEAIKTLEPHLETK